MHSDEITSALNSLLERWGDKNPKGTEMAQSLLVAYDTYGRLTDGQTAWLIKNCKFNKIAIPDFNEGSSSQPDFTGVPEALAKLKAAVDRVDGGVQRLCGHLGIKSE